MSTSEENTVKNITDTFLKESIPEYILENARSILERDGVQKLDLKKREKYWDIEGRIQSDDFQVYNPEIGINLSEDSVNFFCNCPDSFTGVCPHVGATMLKILSTLEDGGEEAAPRPRTDWRHTFRPFFFKCARTGARKQLSHFPFFP